MHKNIVLALLPAVAQGASAQDAAHERSRSLGVVTVSGGQPSSLPTQAPTTVEGVTREQIATTINASDSEDALKYLPSLMVRKRYIGDYNHAILSKRASGTGNSARSAVYADGILLSNFLGNGIANGTNYAPRWGLVTPEEIERPGTLQQQGGTGWNTLAAKGIWRPQGVGGAHVCDVGTGRDAYKLDILKSAVVGDWQSGDAGALVSQVGGRTTTWHAFAQDAWAFAPRWKAVLGIDNLNNQQHWAFHPYPQRTHSAELKFSL